jgi:hypothetical protein
MAQVGWERGLVVKEVDCRGGIGTAAEEEEVEGSPVEDFSSTWLWAVVLEERRGVVVPYG